jgi:hypothetical protein
MELYGMDMLGICSEVMSESVRKMTPLFGLKIKLWAFTQLDWHIKQISPQSQDTKPVGGKVVEGKSSKNSNVIYVASTNE